jgi:hypothetical protein
VPIGQTQQNNPLNGNGDEGRGNPRPRGRGTFSGNKVTLIAEETASSAGRVDNSPSRRSSIRRWLISFVWAGFDRIPRPANHVPKAPADGCANAPYHSAGTRYAMALQPMGVGGHAFCSTSSATSEQ